MTEPAGKNIAAYLSLFTSASTLVCCALPAAVVTIAGGAVMAGLVSTFPQLVWLSEHKYWLFGIAFVLLAVAGIWQWKNRNAPCPVDPKAAKACTRLRKINLRVYIFSVLLFAIGAFFAFIAPLFI